MKERANLVKYIYLPGVLGKCGKRLVLTQEFQLMSSDLIVENEYRKGGTTTSEIQTKYLSIGEYLPTPARTIVIRRMNLYNKRK